MAPLELAATATPQSALVVSSTCTEADMVPGIVREVYSYPFVYRAFASLLERWGPTVEITRPESRLDHALTNLRQQNLEPLHLSFLPLSSIYLTAQAPNVAYSFWEYPDLPHTALGNNPRTNWVRIAARLALILTASPFTREAFARAGVTTPVHVVPVPVHENYFTLPAWEPRQHCRLECPAYVFPQPAQPAPPRPSPWRAAGSPQDLQTWATHVYQNSLRPHLPGRLDRLLTLVIRGLQAVRKARQQETWVPYAVSPHLDLGGVVYTAILDPFCPRQNWQDLLSAFVLAFRDCADACLVVKLVVRSDLAAKALNRVIGHYLGLGLQHQCRIAFVSECLSDAQMLELARASTYCVSTARAEGTCLPLQDYLAAGRPGIAPVHTALADCFSQEVGLVLASNPEPAAWPNDPDQRCLTTWHRLVWQSLFEQLRHSYLLAKSGSSAYQDLARRGRERLREYASAERVWLRLAAALATVAPKARPTRQEGAEELRVPLRRSA